jgi:hypothetical protein
MWKNSTEFSVWSLDQGLYDWIGSKRYSKTSWDKKYINSL